MANTVNPTNAATAGAKTQRHRSPYYPAIDLEAALQRTLEFYTHERRNATTVPIAATHWGFKATSSSGATIVAALKSFGLMRDTGSRESRKVQLTDMALKIILDEREGSPEKAAALKEAALLPRIHRSFWTKYRSNLPSDQSLRYELRHEYDFNENAVEQFIKEYKATIKFSNLTDSDITPELNADIMGPEKGNEEAPYMPDIQTTKPIPASVLVPAQAMPAGSKPVGASIPVTRECSMTVMATGPVTQKGIDQLMAYLKLVRDSFPEN